MSLVEASQYLLYIVILKGILKATLAGYGRFRGLVAARGAGSAGRAIVADGSVFVCHAPSPSYRQLHCSRIVKVCPEKRWDALSEINVRSHFSLCGMWATDTKFSAEHRELGFLFSLKQSDLVS